MAKMQSASLLISQAIKQLDLARAEIIYSRDYQKAAELMNRADELLVRAVSIQATAECEKAAAGRP